MWIALIICVAVVAVYGTQRRYWWLAGREERRLELIAEVSGYSEPEAVGTATYLLARVNGSRRDWERERATVDAAMQKASMELYGARREILRLQDELRALSEGTSGA